MHSFDDSPASPSSDDGRPWWKLLTRYHWFVLVVASLGWLFDTMDQQLFVLARSPAMQELVPRHEEETDQEFRNRAEYYGGNATAIFLIGWAMGGMFFGVLGDRIGRAKTMLLTILVYSLCTGLSALSRNIYDFSFYRFLTGLGVGGEFAVGVALVAEVVPDRARPFALALLQALSTIGNIAAAVINLYVGQLESQGFFDNFELEGFGKISPWRLMFVIGTIPALLAILIRRNLKEPERWTNAVGKEQSNRKGSFVELLGTPRWRRNALVGLAMAISGQIGLWGIGFYFPELTRSVFRQYFQTPGYSPKELEGSLKFWASIASMLFNLGAFFGIYGFSFVTHRFGRKKTFALSYLAALLSTVFVFGWLKDFSDVFWMIPLMGFCQLSLFGGYAIYFPELFPTHLRSTGTSFCYNAGRLAAAGGPLVFGLLISDVFSGLEPPLPHRYAGITMCSVFLVGLLALPFAPETKGEPLPD